VGCGINEWYPQKETIKINENENEKKAKSTYILLMKAG
jgi:hypothetical protein